MHTLQVFGGAVVKAPDGREVHFRSRKHLALLVYLAAHAQRACSREELAQLLWDTDESAARHSLSQALYDLRRQLRRVRLRTRGGAVRLSDGQIRYEGAELEEAVRRGSLADVPSLYRGEFAPNLQQLGVPRWDRWLESERTRYTTVAQMALRRFAEECDLKGRWGEMCLTALRLVRLDPLDEAAHRALMRALWLHGDQQSALRHYREVEDFLIRELPGGVSPETRELVQRIRSSRPPARDPEGDSPGEPPLVGRVSEFEVLRGSLRSLRQGEGGVVIVRGEAGIGKTRLLQELTKLVPVEGVMRLSSRCYSAESDVAYGPVVDGVRPVAERLVREPDEEGRRYFQLGYLFPELFRVSPERELHGADPDVRKRRLYEEVTDLVRRACATTPVLWIVEDIQWIDPSSSSLLHYMCRRLRDHSLLLVLSLRTEQEISDSAERLLEASLGTTGSRAIELQPLPKDAIYELVRTMDPAAGNGHAAKLAAEYSGGNPFYALEILRAADSVEESEGEGLPARCLSDRLRHLLAARLRGVGPSGLRVLEAVAVLGRYATPENVASVAGIDNNDVAGLLQILSRRSLIHSSNPKLSLRHDLLREFIYHELGELRKAAVHLAAAEVLAKDRSVSAATLAHHFASAGDEGRTYAFAIRAAAEAGKACAYQEAITMAELAFTSAASPEDATRALEIEALTELHLGRFDAAAEHLTGVLGLGDSLSVSKRVELGLAKLRAEIECLHFGDALKTAATLQKEVLALGDVREQLDRRCELLAFKVKLGLRNGDEGLAREADQEMADVLNAAEEKGYLTPAAEMEGLSSRALFATFTGSTEKAYEILSSIRRAESDTTRTLRLSLNRSLVAMRLGKWAEAEALAARGMQLAQEHNDLLYLADLKNNLACILYEQGEWHRALAECQTALRLYNTLEAGDSTSLPTIINLANIYFYLEDPQRARRKYAEALSAALRRGDRTVTLELQASLGLVALGTRRYEEAARLWRQIVGAGFQDRARASQDFHKLFWFTAAIEQLVLPEVSVGPEVRAYAADLERRDVVEAMKLEWLSLLFDSAVSRATHARTDISAARSRLRQAGLGWFVRFTERWFDRNREALGSGTEQLRPLFQDTSVGGDLRGARTTELATS